MQNIVFGYLTLMRVAIGRFLEEYAKQGVLNLGQALQSIRYFYSHPAIVLGALPIRESANRPWPVWIGAGIRGALRSVMR
jgi:hypothetical protein